MHLSLYKLCVPSQKVEHDHTWGKAMIICIKAKQKLQFSKKQRLQVIRSKKEKHYKSSFLVFGLRGRGSELLVGGSKVQPRVLAQEDLPVGPDSLFYSLSNEGRAVRKSSIASALPAPA